MFLSKIRKTLDIQSILDLNNFLRPHPVRGQVSKKIYSISIVHVLKILWERWNHDKVSKRTKVDLRVVCRKSSWVTKSQLLSNCLFWFTEGISSVNCTLQYWRNPQMRIVLVEVTRPIVKRLLTHPFILLWVREESSGCKSDSRLW